MGDFMSSIVVSGDTSGAITIAAPAVSGTNTLTLPAVTGSVVVSGQNSAITQGTAQNSTSGTSIDFTGIPSWVKRITVMFNNFSTNGTSVPIMRIGTSSGIVSTGYTSGGAYVGAAMGSGNRTDGYLICGNGWASGNTMAGHAILTNISGNAWVQSFCFGQTDQGYALIGGGYLSLSGTLDRVRITTVNGTDAFDNGSINILYE